MDHNLQQATSTIHLTQQLLSSPIKINQNPPFYNNQPSQRCNTPCVSPTLRDCIDRPFPSSTCFLDNSRHTRARTHIQNYFWRISFQSSSVSIETFNEGLAPNSPPSPRNNRYHYHSARRRTIWTGSHGQLQGGAWYRQLKFMPKSLTFVHGRRIEG